MRRLSIAAMHSALDRLASDAAAHEGIFTMPGGEVRKLTHAQLCEFDPDPTTYVNDTFLRCVRSSRCGNMVSLHRATLCKIGSRGKLAPFNQKARNFLFASPQDDAFINILEGSVRSGKTWAMICKLFVLSQHKVAGKRLICGVSKGTIKGNILDDIFKFVGERNYQYNLQTGDLTIFGAQWSVVGAKDEGSEKYIRGLTVGVAYVDEATLIPESFFKQLLLRMSDDAARLYTTTNPGSPFHWLKKDFLDNKKMRDARNVSSIHFVLDDNLSLSEAKKEQYRSTYKGVYKKRFIDGLWVIAEGAIYKDSYDDDLLYDDDTRPAGLLQRGVYHDMSVAIDYGTGNPTVFLLIIDDGNTYWVDREYYYDSRDAEATGNVQKTDAQYASDLQAFLTEYCPDAQCIVDPSAASFKVEMVQRGIWHCDADNEVLDGIRLVSNLLASKKIRIHKRCQKLIAELQTYSWDEKAAKLGEDKPVKQHDHAPDALRYFCKTKVQDYRLSI